MHRNLTKIFKSCIDSELKGQRWFQKPLRPQLPTGVKLTERTIQIQNWAISYGKRKTSQRTKQAVQRVRTKRIREWRRKWQPTPVFLSGKSHGQRGLVGYNPWSHKSQIQLSNWAYFKGEERDLNQGIVPVPGCVSIRSHNCYRLCASIFFYFLERSIQCRYFFVSLLQAFEAI